MTGIAEDGRCLQRSWLERSSLIEDTSSRNSLRACSVRVSNSSMDSRLRWRTNWCLCGTRSCWGKDTSSSALMNCSRTKPTLFTQDTARYTTLSWTCVLPLQHTASLRTSQRHCRCMCKNQGSWNSFHAKLIPNSSIDRINYDISLNTITILNNHKKSTLVHFLERNYKIIYIFTVWSYFSLV